MAVYFVDTWFFIAHLHELDPHHARALRIGRSLRDATFVTHDGVLTEFLTFFSSYGTFWRTAASALVREVIAGRRFTATPMTRELFEQALALYENRLDKEYSLVDCASMVLMRRRQVTHALTNDHHFRQEGFVVVNQ